MIEQNRRNLTATIRTTISDGTFYIGGLALNAKLPNTTIPNNSAILPAWRSAPVEMLMMASDWDVHAPFSDEVAIQDRLTNEVMPALRAITPGSGSYLNEGDFQLKTWKEDFYGRNYGRLRAVKRKYDPSDVFYATTAVGSEE